MYFQDIATALSLSLLLSSSFLVQPFPHVLFVLIVKTAKLISEKQHANKVTYVDVLSAVLHPCAHEPKDPNWTAWIIGPK